MRGAPADRTNTTACEGRAGENEHIDTQGDPLESIFTHNARLLVEGLAHALEGPLATPALALRDGPLGLGLPLYSVLLVGLFLVLLGLFILDSLWLDGLLVGLFILLVGLFIVYC